MPFPEVIIIGTGAHYAPHSDTSQIISVEVVLIDKTHHMRESGHAQPSVYQIHELPLDERFEGNSQDMARQLGDDAFVMMGEVQRVNKAERRLYLGNGTIVVYKHLIIAAGSRHTYVGHDNVQEFQTGIHALAEALRFRKLYLQIANNGKDSQKQSGFQAPSSGFSAKKSHERTDEVAEVERVLAGLVKSKEWKSGEGNGVAVGSQMAKVFCEVQVAS